MSELIENNGIAKSALQGELCLGPFLSNDVDEMQPNGVVKPHQSHIPESRSKEIIPHPTMFSSVNASIGTKPSRVLRSEQEQLSTKKMKTNNNWTIQYPREYLIKCLQPYKAFSEIVGNGILKTLPDALQVWVNEHSPNVRLESTPVPWRPSEKRESFRLKVNRCLYEECIDIVMSHGKITKSQAAEITLYVALNLLKTRLSKQVSVFVRSEAENISHAFD